MREQDTVKPTTTWGERPPIRQGRTRSVHRTRLAIAGALLLAVILVLVLASTAFAFPDVGSKHRYLTAITALSDRGVISGFGDGTFGPEKLVKRQQFAKMIVLDLGFPVTASDICTFKDVDPSTNPADPLYPDHYVAVAATKLLVQGYPADNTFRPLNSITR
ncbi:MAG TPA: S-layer homology domain-containing protein, partial [Thermoleophilia bacterium]